MIVGIPFKLSSMLWRLNRQAKSGNAGDRIEDAEKIDDSESQTGELRRERERKRKAPTLLHPTSREYRTHFFFFSKKREKELKKGFCGDGGEGGGGEEENSR